MLKIRKEEEIIKQVKMDISSQIENQLGLYLQIQELIIMCICSFKIAFFSLVIFFWTLTLVFFKNSLRTKNELIFSLEKINCDFINLTQVKKYSQKNYLTKPKLIGHAKNTRYHLKINILFSQSPG